MKLFLSYLLIYGLKNNLIVLNASGVTQLQREKKYTNFRYLSSMFVCVGVLLCSMIAFFVKNLIIDPFDMQEIYLSIITIIVLLYNLIVATILNAKSTFIYYLYDRSVSYVLDSVFIISVIYSLDMAIDILPYLLSVFAAVIAIFVTNIIVGLYVKFINKSYVIPSFRKVPITLLLLSVFSILLYYLSF